MSVGAAAHPVIDAAQGLVLNRDALFHMLLGSDPAVILAACERAAARVAAHTGEDAAHALVAAGRASRAHMQCAFIVLLHVDPELRREVLAGSALSVRTRPLCEYKAARLFEALHPHVIDPWIRTEANAPGDLVAAFRHEYLVS
jgi:Holliday junction resolvasome RuvABC endonuclease subunit